MSKKKKSGTKSASDQPVSGETDEDAVLAEMVKKKMAVKKKANGSAADEPAGNETAKKQPAQKKSSRADSGITREGEGDNDEDNETTAAADSAGSSTKKPKPSRKSAKAAAAAEKRRAKEQRRREDAADEEADETAKSKPPKQPRNVPWFVELKGRYKTKTRDVLIDNLHVVLNGQTLLKEGTKLHLIYTKKYGMVGRNGLGKSVMLRKIAAREPGLGIPDYLKILHVEQEVQGDDTCALDSVLRADQERDWLLAEVARLEAIKQQQKQAQATSAAAAAAAAAAAVPSSMGTKTQATKEADGEAEEEEAAEEEEEEEEEMSYTLPDLYERLRDIESDKAEARASAILAGLGFAADEIRTKPTKHYSGGWRMRISLARALFSQPDLLLLDEPNNHLDLEACIWLEGYLADWKKTLLVVSHDPSFLNEFVDNIVHLHNHTFTQYKGDYSSFLKQRAMHQRAKSKAAGAQQKEAQRLREQGQRMTGGAGRLRRERLAKLEHVEVDVDDPTLKFAFPDTGGLGPLPLKFRDVSFRFPTAEPLPPSAAAASSTSSTPTPAAAAAATSSTTVTTVAPIPQPLVPAAPKQPPPPLLFKKLNFGIDTDSRIALVGRNGVGKSTLINLMAGNLQPTSGEIERDRHMRTARFHQHHVDQLDLTATVMGYMRRQFPDADEHDVRAHLAKFGLVNRMPFQTIETLSGGQKSRVVFAELVWKKPHILFLDEPTNHLDLQTIESLATALADFDGGVVLITHNQYLVELACTEIWVVGNQTVQRFEGSFAEYKKAVAKELGFESV